MATIGVTGGDKIEKILSDIAKKAGKKATLKVGFLESAKYPDGTPAGQVAFWNEFGTAKIPPRPFFRPMIAAKSAGWGEFLGKMAVVHNYDIELVLGLLGDRIESQLRESIINVNSPPLSTITLLIRKWKSQHTEKFTGANFADLMQYYKNGVADTSGVNTKPLQDTKFLGREAVSSEVEVQS